MPGEAIASGVSLRSLAMARREAVNTVTGIITGVTTITTIAVGTAERFYDYCFVDMHSVGRLLSLATAQAYHDGQSRGVRLSDGP